MQQIQRVALDLFEERGYERVTIEEIAAVSEVSPSSVYNYFQTKEGILVYGSGDEDFLGRLLELVGGTDPRSALRAALAEASVADPLARDSMAARRLHFLLTVPSARASLLLAVDSVVQAVAGQLRADAARDYDHVTSRAVAAGAVWSVFGALLGWFESGANESVVDAMRRALEVTDAVGSVPGG